MTLLERDEGRDQLRQAFNHAVTEHGRCVFVSGEAGVGKSTLIRHALDDLPTSTPAFVGACDAMATPRPLGPLADILTAASEWFDSGIPVDIDDADPHRILSNLLAWLTRISPAVLVIEDLHWADSATNDLLLYLGRRIDTTRSLIVATFRNDEVGPDHPLRRVMADVGPSTRIVVPPLSRQAVATLADEVDEELAPGFAETVFEVSGGNAFFVTEMLAAPLSIPETVFDAVLARVSRLPPEARRLVDAVSVSPATMLIATALSVADMTSDEAAPALDAGVLVAEGSRLRFRHELARTVIYESINAVDRVELHRRMLAHELAGGTPDAAAVTHHAVAANDIGLVATWAPQAARQAEVRRAHREAITFYSAALDTADEEHRPELLLSRAERYRIDGQPDEALSDAQLAVDLARRRSDDALLGRALPILALAMSAHDHVADLDGVLVESMALLEQTDQHEALATTAFQHAFDAMLARTSGEAFRRLANAGKLVDAVDNEELRYRCRLLEGYINLVTGSEHAGYECITEIEAEVRRTRRDMPMTFMANLGSGLGEIRRYDEARGYLQNSIEAGRRYDEDFGIAYARAWLARIEFESGHWDEAATLASSVLAEPHLHYTTVTAAGTLGRTRVRRGDPHGLELLVGTLEATGGGWLQQRWPLVAGIVEHHWLNGDHDAAAAALEGPLNEAMAMDSPWCRGELSLWGSLIGLVSEPPDNVAEPFRLHLGRQWQAAADTWAEIGCPYEQALALANGDEAMMLSGLEIFHSLGAAPAASWLRARLRSIGVGSVPLGPRKSTKANSFGLTARQSDVLDLVVRGLSNAQIAEDLYISKRTVEHHVSAILAKLGVASRAEVMAKASGIVGD